LIEAPGVPINSGMTPMISSILISIAVLVPVALGLLGLGIRRSDQVVALEQRREQVRRFRARSRRN
jgi:hypothetical protein